MAPAPCPGQVLVRIHAVSLNIRDLLIARGQAGGQLLPELVPASDAAGEVVSVGTRVLTWVSGDRVIAGIFGDDVGGPITPEVFAGGLGLKRQGTLQEYRVFPATQLVRFSEHMSYEEAATLVGAGLTAYTALMSGPLSLKAGQTVVLQGTGSVSVFGAQIALASGARAILTSSSDEKLKTVSEKLPGLSGTVNYKTHPEWSAEILRLTGGRGADFILDVGGGTTLSQSVKAVAPFGQVAIVGILGGIQPPPDLIMSVLLKSAIVRGVAMGGIDFLRDFVRFTDDKKLRPLAGRVFAFEDAKKAFECMEKQDFVGKVILKVSNT
ncbi:alcohol dehydrogenase [Auricularia subglabra TFB-10046 SS5]|nr:alcohol dehydrogenase [Auricularia subglabra TFB-10046 SS5]